MDGAPDARLSPRFGCSSLVVARADSNRVYDLFQQLHNLNTDRIAKPVRGGSGLEVGSLGESGETIVVFCALEPVCIWDSDTEQTRLNLVSDDGTVSLDELLESLARNEASQTILMMDLCARAPGIANGRLSSDEFQLIKSTVSSTQLKGLHVLCACGPGERNWEYSVQRQSVDEEADDQGRSEQSVGENGPGFEGTVFARAVEEAILNEETSSVEEFAEFVKSRVSEVVKSRFQAVQTVQLISAGSSPSEELMVRIHAPDAVGADEADDTDSSSSDLESSDTDSAAAKSDDPGIPETKHSRLAALMNSRNELALVGEAPVVSPGGWQQLQSALLNARWALINGHQAFFESSCGRAEQHIDRFELLLADDQDRSAQEARYGSWFVPDRPLSQEEEASLEAAFQSLSLKPAEGTPPVPLPTTLAVGSPLRERVGIWLTSKLQKTSTAIGASSPEIQKNILESWQRFVAHPSLIGGWLPQEWPQELLTLAEVFDTSVGFEDKRAEAIQNIARLLKLRRDVLSVCSGKQNGKSIRKSFFTDSDSNRIRPLLTRLTEAECWICVGDAGSEMAELVLNQADADWLELNGDLRHHQELLKVRDFQQSEMPWLLQFVARLQEDDDMLNMYDPAIDFAKSMESGERSGNESFLNNFGKQLTSEDVGATWQLTRDFENSALTDTDPEEVQALQLLIRRRTDQATGPMELRRLAAVPDLGESADGWESRLSHSSVGVGRDQSRQTSGPHRQTGLWLSFWSIRLLSALTHDAQRDLWTDWRELAEASRDATKEIVERRIELGTRLSAAWEKYEKTRIEIDREDLFASRQTALELMAYDIQTRLRSGSALADKYGFQLTHAPFDGTPLAVEGGTLEIGGNDFSAVVGADGSISIPIKVAASRCFVSSGSFRLVNEGAQLMPGWFQVAGRESSSLNLQAGNTITQRETVIIAAADDDGILTAVERIQINPNADAKWRLRILTEKDKPASEVVLRGGELTIPPSTLVAPEMHQPVPVFVMLEKLQGNIPQAKVVVRLIGPDGKSQVASDNVLSFADTDQVPIPFQSADVEKADAAAPTTLKTIHAVQFSVTPWSDGSQMAGSKTYSSTVQLVTADISEYLEIQTPRYSNEDQTLTLRVRRRRNIASLSPPLVPVRIHFSLPLQSLIEREQSDDVLVPDLQSEAELRFVFRDGIQTEFSNELEFGLSGAGIPHAKRWQLLEDGAVPIGGDSPRIRTTLLLLNSKEVKLIPDTNTLLLAGDWVKARIRADVHVFGGGRINRNAPAHRLSIRRSRQDATQTPVEIFRVESLKARRSETVQLTAGEEGAWLITSETTPWSVELAGRDVAAGSAVPLQSDGRFRLQSELTSLTEQGAGAEHAQTLVLDSSPPTVTAEDIEFNSEGQQWILRDLEGVVSVRDAQSGIKSVEVGLSADKLIPAEVRGNEASFKIRKVSFPELERKETRNEQEATLYVRVTNKAGLSTAPLIQHRFEFYRRGKETPGGPETGNLTFSWPTSSSYTVTLTGKESKNKDEYKNLKGESPLVFEDLPVGKYTIKWKTSGVTGNGEAPVSVRKGSNNYVKRGSVVKRE